MQLIRVSFLASFVFAFASVISVPLAHAQQCTQDSDCTEGLICRTFASSQQINANCDLPDCKSDADCPGGTICHSEERCSFEEGPAPGGGCTMETVQKCEYRYQLPCAQDSDCGGGFTCQIFGSFPGGDCNLGEPNIGDPIEEEDAGAEPPDGPPCEMPAPSGMCQLIETTCKTNDDCADGLACSAPSGGSGFCNPMRLGDNQNGGANGGGGQGGPNGPNGPGGQGGNGGMYYGDGGMGEGDDEKGGFKLCSVANPGAGSETPWLALLGLLGLVVVRGTRLRRR